MLQWGGGGGHWVDSWTTGSPPPSAEADILQKYPDNRLLSQYTLYSFIPKYLFEQFRRIPTFISLYFPYS